MPLAGDALFEQLCHDGELIVGIEHGMDKAGQPVEKSLFQHIRLDEPESGTRQQRAHAIATAASPRHLVG